MARARNAIVCSHTRLDTREGAFVTVFPLREATQLNAEMTKFVIEAPAIARKALPGQFVIIRQDEFGERIPLTISQVDVDAGTICVIFQAVGASTARMRAMESGQALRDVTGPLGCPTEFGNARRICVIGGGLGTAIAYPEAKWLHDDGRSVDCIVGFRTRDIIMLEDELRACCDTLTVMTDDGSNGNAGFVTVALQHNIDAGAAYDLVIAIGPPVMMRNVCSITRAAGIRTLVSLNSIMIDGTGMCGGCRVRVGGEYKHACVDGPDFDGHAVDWDEVMHRATMYRAYEREAVECRTSGTEGACA